MRVLIFGGTTEGRRLSAALSGAGIQVMLSVATEYGKSSAADDAAEIFSDRLTEEEMVELLGQEGSFDCVIDATHPYAVLVTQNIRSACRTAGLQYIRLKRPESGVIPGVTYVPDMFAAVELLSKSDGKALLTIGSKQLDPFTGVPNYAERLFVRMLPMLDSLEKATRLGFRGSNIICMQGPFDSEMNAAMLKMTGAKFLVTKNSGDPGGFEAKISAALNLGCEVIVVERPAEGEGYTLDEILNLLGAKTTSEEIQSQPAFFPLFVDISGKKVLVTGCGNVAERRVKVLQPFGADITVISPTATEYIEHAASLGEIRLLKRKYQPGDVAAISPFFVVAATDDRLSNHSAMTEASSLNIPVSVADCREECTCYFPAIAESENYIAGLVSKNGDHAGVKRMAEKIRGLINT